MMLKQQTVLTKSIYEWLKKFGTFNKEAELQIVEDDELEDAPFDIIDFYYFIIYALPELGNFKIPLIQINEDSLEEPKNLELWFRLEDKWIYGPEPPEVFTD